MSSWLISTAWLYYDISYCARFWCILWAYFSPPSNWRLHFEMYKEHFCGVLIPLSLVALARAGYTLGNVSSVGSWMTTAVWDSSISHRDFKVFLHLEKWPWGEGTIFGLPNALSKSLAITFGRRSIQIDNYNANRHQPSQKSPPFHFLLSTYLIWFIYFLFSSAVNNTIMTTIILFAGDSAATLKPHAW